MLYIIFYLKHSLHIIDFKPHRSKPIKKPKKINQYPDPRDDLSKVLQIYTLPTLSYLFTPLKKYLLTIYLMCICVYVYMNNIYPLKNKNKNKNKKTKTQKHTIKTHTHTHTHKKPLSPRTRYLDNCLREHVNPRASLIIRKLATTHISLKSLGIGDTMARYYHTTVYYHSI